MLDSETIACCPPRMMHAVGPKKKSKAQKEAERLQAEEEERKAEILRVKREAERVRKEAEDAKRLKEEQVCALFTVVSTHVDYMQCLGMCTACM